MNLELRGPDGIKASLGDQDLAAASGRTAAQVLWQVQLVAPSAGDYELTSWLPDAAGNDSNRETARITATAEQGPK